LYRWILAIIGLAAIAALGSGCGGSGEDEATASVTKAQFVKEADAICAERNKKWDASVASYKKKLQAENASLDEEHVGELISSSLVPLMKDELGQMEGLGAPAGDEESIDKMLGARSKAVAELEAEPLAVYSSESLNSFSSQAAAYGLKCPL
jgi:hypothetical protein